MKELLAQIPVKLVLYLALLLVPLLWSDVLTRKQLQAVVKQYAGYEQSCQVLKFINTPNAYVPDATPSAAPVVKSSKLLGSTGSTGTKGGE